jgi:hypothetical protein
MKKPLLFSPRSRHKFFFKKLIEQPLRKVMALIVRKDTDSNVQQTLRHVHDPLPSPLLNLSLMRNLFSWAERLAVTYQQALSPHEVPSLSALTLSLGQDSAFARIAHNLNQLALETLEEGEPKLALLLEEARRLIEAQIASDRAIQAKAQSLQDLREKALQISSLKEQAFIFYFNNGGRETRQKLDEAMVSAATGVLKSQDRTIPDLYWKAAASNPWGAEWHQVLEKGVYHFFCQAMQEGFYRMNSLSNPQFKKLYGCFLKKSLKNSIKIVAKQWLLRRDQVKFMGDVIKLNYMILKGRLWTTPLIQHCLKKILEPLIFKTEHAVQNLASQKAEQIQKQIAAHLEELNSPSCCIDPAVITKEGGCPEGQLECRLHVNKSQRERCLKALAQLQAFTFEDCLKWACQEWGYNPLEMKSVLAEETPFDRNVIAVLSLTSVIEDPEEELKLDLTALPDPIAYFAKRFKERDEQALALLSRRVEEV